MLYFQNDYLQGAHPAILNALIESNNEHLSGYGLDVYVKRASEKIKKAIDCQHAQISFLVGGTQTNAIVIDTLLDATEGVIAADTGHVNVHEAGAIEATGHKVLTLPGYDGKIRAEDVQNYLDTFYADESHSHMVYPGMVYISQPTEYGTVYSLNELEQLRTVCDTYGIPLFIDGARLIYTLHEDITDVSLSDIARLSDVFYIGGTKAGLLCGEAVIFTKNNEPKRFMTKIKQHLGLLAKGRLLSIQFDALFTDNLYKKIATQTHECSQCLRGILSDKGYRFYVQSPTNQQFVVVSNEKMIALKKNVQVSHWQSLGAEQSVVRFATSWSTTLSDVKKLEEVL